MSTTLTPTRGSQEPSTVRRQPVLSAPHPTTSVRQNPTKTARVWRHVRTGLGGIALIGTVLVASICVGIELATPDGSGLAQRSDRGVAEWFVVHRWGPVVSMSRLLSILGSIGPALLLAAVVGALLYRHSARVALLALPVSVVAATELAGRVVAGVVVRPRPDATLALTTQGGFAWPASRAACAVALAVTLHFGGSVIAEATRRRVRVGFGAMAFGVAASQLVLGVQWVSDVAIAVVLGSVIAVVVCRATDSSLVRRVPPAAVNRRRRSLRRTAGLVVGVALVPVLVSYGRALSAPGAATLDVRSIEWLRDNGLGGTVDRAETWWLWRNMPSSTRMISVLPPPPLSAESGTSRSTGPGPAIGSATPVLRSLPAPAVVATTSFGASPLPAPVPSVLRPTLPGEGTWTQALGSASHVVSVATTRLRPDARHPSVVVSLAWMNARTTAFTLIRGTRQPGGGPGRANGSVPAAQRASLVAAFNSGYRLSDIRGGAIEEGTVVRPLVAGDATLGIRPDGSVSIVAWGRDPTQDGRIVAARQNLHLIVDHGRLVPGLRFNVGGRWGKVANALPTWRSGIGVDSGGNVLYAGGDGLTLDALAEALRRGGAVTAMELDIHKHMVIFNLFTHDGLSGGPIGHKLSPDMPGNPNRYLVSDQRDFVMVVAR